LDQYLGLVHHAARETIRQFSGSLDLEDLVSAGTIGLVQALEGFDPSLGFAFSTYALPRIRGAIMDEIRSWDWVPRSIREHSRDLRQATEELRRQLGRDPKPDEVAEALGVDLKTYWRYTATSRDPVVLSLDPVPEAGDQPSRLSETLPDPSAEQMPETLAEAETRLELAASFEALSKRDRLILSLSFYEGLTLQQIGKILHITESRVSQLRTRALRRLREAMSSKEEAA